MEIMDFSLTNDGELNIDNETHDIETKTKNDLKIQLAYDRIKSISTNWFMDEIGANLEELVGKECSEYTAEYGKSKIISQLIIDDLFAEEDIYIKAEIVNNTMIKYNIYLRLYQEGDEDGYSFEIEATLDLVKGVFVRYGW